MIKNKNIEEIKNGYVSFDQNNYRNYECTIDYVERLNNNSDFGYFYSFQVDFSKGIYVTKEDYEKNRNLNKEEIEKDFSIMIYNFENKIIIPQLDMFSFFKHNDYVNEVIFAFNGCGLNCKIVKIKKTKVFFVCENSVFV